jgi:predicted membrane-bound dolichyl-phosphate-mannose-protein mannosyltransferase
MRGSNNEILALMAKYRLAKMAAAVDQPLAWRIGENSAGEE